MFKNGFLGNLWNSGGTSSSNPSGLSSERMLGNRPPSTDVTSNNKDIITGCKTLATKYSGYKHACNFNEESGRAKTFNDMATYLQKLIELDPTMRDTINSKDPKQIKMAIQGYFKNGEPDTAKWHLFDPDAQFGIVIKLYEKLSEDGVFDTYTPPKLGQ